MTTDRGFSLLRDPVQIHVEQEDIHPLLPQKAELASLHMALYQSAHGRHRQVPGIRYPGRLEHRRSRRDVGIKTRAGGGD